MTFVVRTFTGKYIGESQNFRIAWRMMVKFQRIFGVQARIINREEV